MLWLSDLYIITRGYERESRSAHDVSAVIQARGANMWLTGVAIVEQGDNNRALSLISSNLFAGGMHSSRGRQCVHALRCSLSERITRTRPGMQVVCSQA
jgi:hypothetical protein